MSATGSNGQPLPDPLANSIVRIVGGLAALALVAIVAVFIFAGPDREGDLVIHVVGFATTIIMALLALVGANNAIKVGRDTHGLLNSNLDAIVEARAEQLLKQRAGVGAAGGSGGGGGGSSSAEGIKA